MPLDWVEVSLRGHGGAKPTGTTFFELIGVKPRDRLERTPSDEPWQSAVVQLLLVDRKPFHKKAEPDEAFHAEVRRGLVRAARWLDARRAEGFDEWRKGRKTADVFVGGWLDGDQLDLAFPPAFLLACGRLGLPIEICTND
jgi:hypothetical protein